MPTESDELALLLRQFDGETWTRRLRRSDPRHGDLVRRLSPSAASLAEAIEELWRLPADAPDVRNTPRYSAWRGSWPPADQGT